MATNFFDCLKRHGGERQEMVKRTKGRKKKRKKKGGKKAIRPMGKYLVTLKRRRRERARKRKRKHKVKMKRKTKQKGG